MPFDIHKHPDGAMLHLGHSHSWYYEGEDGIGADQCTYSIKTSKMFASTVRKMEEWLQEMGYSYCRDVIHYSSQVTLDSKLNTYMAVTPYVATLLALKFDLHENDNKR